MARKPRRLAQASPPSACGSAFMYPCHFISVQFDDPLNFGGRHEVAINKLSKLVP